MVSYSAGTPIEAANPQDYIYPSDVRINAQEDMLYVRADGRPAVGYSTQTWLFEYDLRGRLIRRRLQVEKGVLPSLCAEPHG